MTEAMTPTSEDVQRIVGSLTTAMLAALQRLADNMVYIDGRSRAALVRRGLAKDHGGYSDALLGDFHIVTITPLGRSALQASQITREE